MKPEKRRLVAQETMDIYAPLSCRMGIQGIRDELEELSFRWLHPAAYETLMSRLHACATATAGLPRRSPPSLKQAQGAFTGRQGFQPREEALLHLAENAEQADRPGAAFRRLRLQDHRADGRGLLRGAGRGAHNLARGAGPLQGLYLDTQYNDYQSLHTTIVGPRHQRAELQIRTAEIHQIAEYGVAAHTGYKLASREKLNGKAPGGEGNGAAPESAAYQWLRKMVDNLLEGDNPEEFLEHTKLELFLDQVFCFTPKADRAAARRQRHRLRLRRPHRCRQPLHRN